MVESDARPIAVQIRAVEDRDLETLFEQQQDPEANQMAAFPARDRDAFMAHWARILADPAGTARTVVADGRVVGNVVSWEQSGRREVGYWIGRAFWGRGIATQALALYLGRVEQRTLHACVAAHNGGSIRVLEKCGFLPTAAPDDSSTETANAYVAEAQPDDVEEVWLVLKT